LHKNYFMNYCRKLQEKLTWNYDLWIYELLCNVGRQKLFLFFGWAGSISDKGFLVDFLMDYRFFENFLDSRLYRMINFMSKKWPLPANSIFNFFSRDSGIFPIFFRKFIDRHTLEIRTSFNKIKTQLHLCQNIHTKFPKKPNQTKPKTK
jgi:hypothetical protein